MKYTTMQVYDIDYTAALMLFRLVVISCATLLLHAAAAAAGNERNSASFLFDDAK